MKEINITTRTKPQKILEYFKEAIKDGTTFNLKTPKGYIYICKGILSKLEGDSHYVHINKHWVKV